MTYQTLAAVRFETGDIDGLFADIANRLLNNGHRVCGVLQSRGEMHGDCHCADMDLHVIGSSRTFRISQSLGNGSHGCRLHPGALAECAAYLEKQLDHGAELLILNRFGRGESEGRGFRDLIGHALGLGIPVLTAVRPTYQDEWQDFGSGLSCDLPMKESAVLNWFNNMIGTCHAA
jgi:hypothetical protein